MPDARKPGDVHPCSATTWLLLILLIQGLPRLARHRCVACVFPSANEPGETLDAGSW
jgi:hypothetical protein